MRGRPPVLLSGRYRQKPAAKVLAELDRVLEVWAHPFIELADDNSFVDRAYWRELLPQIAKRHVRWFAETDVSVGEDPELLGLLRRSGCAEVLIGLESPLADGLDGLESRANWKLGRLGRYREALRAIQAHGIRVNGCFVLGLDGQGPGIFDAVRDFVREADLFDVQITLLTPFPGTPLHARQGGGAAAKICPASSPVSSCCGWRERGRLRCWGPTSSSSAAAMPPWTRR